MFDDHAEKQKELFEEFQKPKRKLKFFENNGFLRNKTITAHFSGEKTIFLLTGIIILTILSFCFGVEHGKRQSVYKEEPYVYKIQVAAYKNKNSAKKTADQIRKMGFPAYLSKSGNFFIIYAGNYNNKKQAETALYALKKNYGGIYIKTVKRK